MFNLMLRDPIFEVFDRLNQESQAVGVYQDKDSVHYHFEVPGMTKEDLRIEVDNRVLLVEGKVEKQNYKKAISEKILLPRSLELDSAVANVNNGLLTISFKKTSESSKKVISIAG